MKRTLVKYKPGKLFTESSWDMYYSNGELERVDLCCPHCKTRGGQGYGSDNLIRPDATRCPHCSGTFKEPEVVSIEYRGNWIEKETKEQEYEDSLIFGFFEPLYFAVLCIILFLWFIVILMGL